MKIFSLRTFLILGGIVLVGSIAWSMWVDTLQPLYRAGDSAALLRNLFGLPLILLGFVVMCWGFIIFLRDFAKLSSDPAWQAASTQRDNQQLSAEERKQAQHKVQKQVGGYLKSSLLMIVSGIGLIVLGGIIRNLY